MIKSIVKEVAFWYALPFVFISLYVLKYDFPLETISSHLYLITLFFSTAVLLKVVSHRLLSSERDALLLTSFVYASYLFSLVSYYALVIMSLGSWGKVITSELLLSYLTNASQFCESIDFPFLLALLILVIGYLLSFVLSHYLIRKHFSFGLKLSFKPHIHDKFLSAVLALGFLLSFHFLLDRLLTPDLGSHEPVNLTLYSGKSYLDSRFYPRLLPYNQDLQALETTAESNYKPSENAKKKNVILIIVDALKLSHMQIYGYERKTTPYLDKLASSGQLQVLHSARASCPETACAMSSLLASRFPHQMPEHAITLIDVLKKHHYATKMILGGDHTNFYSLRKFYGEVDEYYDGAMEKKYFFNDDELVLNKTKQLPKWNNKPIYLQFHLMSAHTLGKHHEKFNLFKPSKSYAGHMEGDADNRYTNHYDNGLVQTDYYIQQLLTTLQEKNYLKNTLVIITADHGETLGEHGLFTHANGLWEELLHIPLLWIDYSQADDNKESASQVNDNKQTSPRITEPKLSSQVDIAPTILEHLQMPVPSTWKGHAFGKTPVNRYLYMRWPPHSGVYDTQSNKIWKYWLNYNTGEEFIYEVTQDPDELQNRVWDPSLQKMKKNWRDMISKDQSLVAR